MAILHIVPKFVAPGPSEFQASFWMDVQPTPTLADVAEIQANITDWLQDMYDTVIPQVQSAITAIEYAMYIHNLLTGEDSFYANGNWTFTGTNSSDGLISQASATVSAGVLTRDRPAQKRMIPFAEAAQANSILSPGALTALGAFATQWISPRPASANFTYEPGLVSVGAPGQFNPFTGTVTVNTVLGTVRSRKRGVGI